MKKFRILPICLVVLLLFGVTVYAYMIKQTETDTTAFVPASVTCEVHEETDTGTSLTSQKNSIKVENTSNIEAYIRVKLNTHWVVYEDGNTIVSSKPSDSIEFALSEGWIAGNDNTYYYTKPVKPGGYTGELLASPIFLDKEDEYFQVVEVFADAIQSKPDDAVSESWGVSVNSNGVITFIE